MNNQFENVENLEMNETGLASEISEQDIFSKIEAENYNTKGADFGFTETSNSSDSSELSKNIESSGFETSQQNNLGEFIDGEFFVDTSDFLISSLILLVAQLIGYEFSKSDFELSDKEKKTLYKPAALWLKSVNVNLNNPLYNFLFAIGMVYAGKFMKAIPKAKKVSKKKTKALQKNADENENFEEQTSQDIDRKDQVKEATEILKKKYVIKNDPIAKYNPEEQQIIRAYITKYKFSKKNAIAKLEKTGAIRKLID